MLRIVLSLVVLLGAVLAADAQQRSDLTGRTPARQTGLKGAFGDPDSATGGLRGVHAPPDSAIGHLRGVYGPAQPSEPAPLSSTLAGSSSTNSGSVPLVSMPGKPAAGQTLPEGVEAAPMPDRPGYGRAMVNDRPAIIDLNDNRIVQFKD